MISSETEKNNIGKKVAKNAGWNYLSFGLGKVLNIVSFSIIAHLLTPELYGLFALATLAIDYLSILNDFGLGAALIHRREDIEEASNTAFTFNLLIGITLTLIVIVTAPYVAIFFDEPLVIPILRWLGITFAINALGSIHRARLRRELRFGKSIIPELSSTVVKIGLSIGFAIKGFGAWSLVYGQLAGVSVNAVLLWIVFPWIPRLTLNLKLMTQLFKYGFSIMTDSAFTTVADSFDYVLIGRFYDKSALGIYQIAYRLPELLVINTLSVLAVVFFPAFASIQNQTEELRKTFLSVVRYVQLLVTPICLGMFIAAEPIVLALMGEQWIQAIPIIRILCLYTLVLSIGYHSGDVFKAIGRPDILLKLALPIFFIRLTAIWIGAQYSLIGIACGHLAASVIELIIRSIVTIKVIKVSPLDILKQLTAFIAGFVLLALAVPTLYLTRELTPWPRLIITIIAGAIGYVSIVWFLERATILKIIKMTGIRTPRFLQQNG
jgi:PST family polysaccharide transporter